MKRIIKNATLINNEKTNIYISDDIIFAIGEQIEDFGADEIIDATDKLVIPGLINAHNHAYMSIFRNSADDLPFDDWLFKNVMPREDKMVPEDAYWGATLSIAEMLSTGTTCFNDMMIHPNQTTRAVADTKIRAVISRGLVGHGDDEGGRIRINEIKQDMLNYKDNPNITFMMGPHAPYSTDAEYLKIVAKEARELGVGIHIHLSESLNEFNNIKKEFGCTPTEYIESTGLFDVKTIAAHCVQLTDRDIDILKKHDVSVASNPVSNMKLGNGFAPIEKLLEKGVNVCIGTDGPASNNSQNLIREMGFMALIHKGKAMNAVSVAAKDIYDMATINGAKALNLDKKVGELKAGMQADIVMLDLDRPQMTPRNNVLSAMCYSANGSEVVLTMVAGKILYKNEEFTTIDMERVRYEVEKACKR